MYHYSLRLHLKTHACHGQLAICVVVDPTGNAIKFQSRTKHPNHSFLCYSSVSLSESYLKTICLGSYKIKILYFHSVLSNDELLERKSSGSGVENRDQRQ
jgi:hypothetical protein